MLIGGKRLFTLDHYVTPHYSHLWYNVPIIYNKIIIHQLNTFANFGADGLRIMKTIFEPQ